jgi:hypothetical protein
LKNPLSERRVRSSKMLRNWSNSTEVVVSSKPMTPPSGIVSSEPSSGGMCRSMYLLATDDCEPWRMTARVPGASGA